MRISGTTGLAVGLLGLGVFLRVANFGNVTERSPDETVYTRHAQVIAAAGPLAGTRQLAREYNADQRWWTLPLPTRIGYDWLLAGLMKVTGRADELTGAGLSLVGSVLGLVIVMWIGHRFFNPVVTLCGLLFLAVSPVDLALARRVWQDALFSLLGLGMIWCCLEIERSPRNRLWPALLIGIGAYLLLIKESGIVVFGLCAAGLAARFIISERAYRPAATFVAACGGAAMISFGLAAYAVGGVDVWRDIYRHLNHVSNPYAVEHQSGPWLNFVAGIFVLSPVSFVLFIIGAAWAIAPWGRATHLRRPAIWLVLFNISFLAVTLLVPNCQNYRYLSVTFAPFYLVAGVGLWAVWAWAEPRISRHRTIVLALLLATLVTAAGGDYQTFQRILIRTGARDLSVKMLWE